MTLSKDELIDLVAFALWHHRQLRPRHESLAELRLWARVVVEHLETAGVVWSRRPSPPPHRTP